MPINDDQMTEYAPAEDALSLLTADAGSEGDAVKGIDATSVRADVARQTEQMLSRTPIQTSDGANRTGTVTFRDGQMIYNGDPNAGQQQQQPSAASATPPSAGEQSLATNTTTSPETNPSQTAGGQPNVPTTASTGALGTVLQGQASKEQPTVTNATGGEHTSPTSNGQTSNGPTSNGPATEQPLATTGAPEAYDPNRIITLKDGTQTTLAALEHGAMLKPRYDQAVTALKKREESLAQKEAVVEANYTYLQALAGDKFAKIYATAREGGATEDAAIRSALEAAGRMDLLQGAPQQGPPEKGSERYYRTPFADLGIKPGTVEYDDWWSGNNAVRQADAVKQATAPLQAEIESLRKNATQTQAVAAQPAVDPRQKANSEALGAIPALLMEEYKIDVSLLTEQERQSLQGALDTSLQKLTKQDDWFRQTDLGEMAVYAAVMNPDVARVATQARERVRTGYVPNAATQGNGQAGNGQQTGNGQAASTQQPQLVRPPVEKVTLSTIGAMPASAGSPPTAPVYQGDEDRQNLDMALDMLSADFRP